MIEKPSKTKLYSVNGIGFAKSLFMPGCHLIAVSKREKTSCEMHRQNFCKDL